MRIKPHSPTALAILAITLVVGCNSLSSWVPLGEVKFLDLKEKSDAQNGKRGLLDYSISNRGKSLISRSTFAFSFATDLHIYRGTIVDETEIASGALVYGRIEIVYENAEEMGDYKSAIVDSAQFK